MRRTELARKAGQQRETQRRLGVDELQEGSPRQRLELGRLEGDGRRRPRLPVQHGELAEEVARSKRRDDRLVPLGRREDDLQGPGYDDEQGVARVAGMEDHLVTAEAAVPQQARDLGERRLVHVAEQRARPEGRCHDRLDGPCRERHTTSHSKAQRW